MALPWLPIHPLGKDRGMSFIKACRSVLGVCHSPSTPIPFNTPPKHRCYCSPDFDCNCNQFSRHSQYKLNLSGLEPNWTELSSSTKSACTIRCTSRHALKALAFFPLFPCEIKTAPPQIFLSTTGIRRL